MNAAQMPILRTALAFDKIARRYDELFTRSVVGRLQRQIVWDAIQNTFEAGQSILELNCGTGEDALFLAKRGARVMACDASARMIEVALRRKAEELPDACIDFRLLPNESLDSLSNGKRFDGAFSNFSGLNCVADLASVAFSLSHLVKPGGRVLLCLSSRVCLWEMAWFLLHGNVRKAFRRTRGRAVARLEEIDVTVFYPSGTAIRRAFGPTFRLRSMRAIGLLIPPSYVEAWAARHSTILAILERLDSRLRDLPILCQLGDHILFDFERAS
jgi:ubiquinone/menaquinone biosynthesis C-methylase UbiE